MSNVYEVWGSDEFEHCQPVDDNDFETIRVGLNGTTLQATWKPIEVQLISNDDGDVLAVSDSPWLGAHALVLRPGAIKGVGTMLREHGELLPLVCRSAELWIFNSTRVIDALDEQASSVTRFRDGGVMRVRRYVFREDVIRGVDIFKITTWSVSPIFVSQRFVDEWNGAGLQGLDFRQVSGETTDSQVGQASLGKTGHE